MLQAAAGAIDAGLAVVGPDVIGLRALNLYGLKGVCAYAHHARVLGYEDPEVYAGVESALDHLAGQPSDVEDLLACALDVGRVGIGPISDVESDLVKAMLRPGNA